MLRGRLRRLNSGRRFIGTTNPGGPEHYLYREFGCPPAPGSPTDRVVWRPDAEHLYLGTSSLENVHLPIDYQADLQRAYEGRDFQRFVLGAWVDPGNRIWPAFLDERNYIQPFDIPPEWPRELAIDFGWEHEFVCLWIAWDERGPEPRAIVYREYYARHKTLREHAEHIWRETLEEEGFRGFREVWGDWDNQDRFELANVQDPRLRLKVRRARKDRLQGQRSVNAGFLPARDGYPRLYVTRDCPRLRAQVLGYRRPDGVAARREDAAIEFDDEGHSIVDGCDALRYGWFSVAGARFQRVVGYEPGMDAADRRRIYAGG